jgi:hypothetical protein
LRLVMPLPVPEALAAMEVEDDTAGGNVFSDDGSQVTVRNTFVQVGQVTPVRVRARALRRHGTDGTDSPVPGNISAGHRYLVSTVVERAYRQARRKQLLVGDHHAVPLDDVAGDHKEAWT